MVNEGHLASLGAQERLRRLDEQRRRQQEADFRAAMQSPEGRRFIYGLVNRANVFGLSFAANAPRTDFNEGRRSLGIDVMQDAHRICPDLWAQAVQEAVEAERVHAIYRRDAEATATTEE